MSSARDRHSLTAAVVRSQVNFVSGIGAHPQPGTCGLVQIGLDLCLTGPMGVGPVHSGLDRIWDGAIDIGPVQFSIDLS